MQKSNGSGEEVWAQQLREVEERAARLEHLLQSRNRGRNEGPAATDGNMDFSSLNSNNNNINSNNRRPPLLDSNTTGPFPGFQGLTNLLTRHENQIAEFERWASARIWPEFHLREFDWWTFPVDEPSTMGDAYRVSPRDVAIMRTDKRFMRLFLRGVELVLLSWGWDLHERKLVDHPDRDQRWSDRPVRLYKIGRSCLLFGESSTFGSLLMFARHLERKGHSLELRPGVHAVRLWEAVLADMMKQKDKQQDSYSVSKDDFGIRLPPPPPLSPPPPPPPPPVTSPPLSAWVDNANAEDVADELLQAVYVHIIARQFGREKMTTQELEKKVNSLGTALAAIGVTSVYELEKRLMNNEGGKENWIPGWVKAEITRAMGEQEVSSLQELATNLRLFLDAAQGIRTVPQAWRHAAQQWKLNIWPEDAVQNNETNNNNNPKQPQQRREEVAKPRPFSERQLQSRYQNTWIPAVFVPPWCADGIRVINNGLSIVRLPSQSSAMTGHSLASVAFATGIHKWKFFLEKEGSDGCDCCVGVAQRPSLGSDFRADKLWVFFSSQGAVYSAGARKAGNECFGKGDTVEMILELSETSGSGTLKFSVNGRVQPEFCCDVQAPVHPVVIFHGQAEQKVTIDCVVPLTVALQGLPMLQNEFLCIDSLQGAKNCIVSVAAQLHAAHNEIQMTRSALKDRDAKIQHLQQDTIRGHQVDLALRVAATATMKLRQARASRSSILLHPTSAAIVKQNDDDDVDDDDVNGRRDKHIEAIAGSLISFSVLLHDEVGKRVESLDGDEIAVVVEPAVHTPTSSKDKIAANIEKQTDPDTGSNLLVATVVLTRVGEYCLYAFLRPCTKLFDTPEEDEYVRLNGEYKISISPEQPCAEACQIVRFPKSIVAGASVAFAVVANDAYGNIIKQGIDDFGSFEAVVVSSDAAGGTDESPSSAAAVAGCVLQLDLERRCYQVPVNGLVCRKSGLVRVNVLYVPKSRDRKEIVGGFQVEVQPGPPSPQHCELVTKEITCNAAETFTLRIQLTDEYENICDVYNPLYDYSGVVSISNGNNDISALKPDVSFTTQAFDRGIIEAFGIICVAGSFEFDVLVNEVVIDVATVVVESTVPSAQHCIVTVLPEQEIIAGDEIRLQLLAKDEFGNTVANPCCWFGLAVTSQLKQRHHRALEGGDAVTNNDNNNNNNNNFEDQVWTECALDNSNGKFFVVDSSLDSPRKFLQILTCDETEPEGSGFYSTRASLTDAGQNHVDLLLVYSASSAASEEGKKRFKFERISRFVVHVEAGSTSSAMFLSTPSVVTAGQKVRLIAQAIDRFGNAVQHGGDILQFQAVSEEGNNDIIVNGEVWDAGNGSYDCQIMMLSAREYQLSLMVQLHHDDNFDENKEEEKKKDDNDENNNNNVEWIECCSHTVTVEPADIHLSSCVVLTPPPDTISTDEQITISAQGRDKFGNPISTSSSAKFLCSVTSSVSAHRVPVQYDDEWEVHQVSASIDAFLIGVHTAAKTNRQLLVPVKEENCCKATMRLTMTGSYRLDICVMHLDSAFVIQSWIVTVTAGVPHPACCMVEGWPQPRMEAGDRIQLRVETRDSFGNSVGHGGAHIKAMATLVSAVAVKNNINDGDDNDAVMTATTGVSWEEFVVTDIGDGNYIASLTPTLAGLRTLNVMILDFTGDNSDDNNVENAGVWVPIGCVWEVEVVAAKLCPENCQIVGQISDKVSVLSPITILFKTYDQFHNPIQNSGDDFAIVAEIVSSSSSNAEEEDDEDPCIIETLHLPFQISYISDATYSSFLPGASNCKAGTLRLHVTHNGQFCASSQVLVEPGLVCGSASVIKSSPYSCIIAGELAEIVVCPRDDCGNRTNVIHPDGYFDISVESTDHLFESWNVIMKPVQVEGWVEYKGKIAIPTTGSTNVVICYVRRSEDKAIIHRSIVDAIELKVLSAEPDLSKTRMEITSIEKKSSNDGEAVNKSSDSDKENAVFSPWIRVGSPLQVKIWVYDRYDNLVTQLSASELTTQILCELVEGEHKIRSMNLRWKNEDSQSDADCLIGSVVPSLAGPAAVRINNLGVGVSHNLNVVVGPSWNVGDWSVKDVSLWLQQHHLVQFMHNFERAEVNGEELLALIPEQLPALIPTAKGQREFMLKRKDAVNRSAVPCTVNNRYIVGDLIVKEGGGFDAGGMQVQNNAAAAATASSVGQNGGGGGVGCGGGLMKARYALDAAASDLVAIAILPQDEDAPDAMQKVEASGCWPKIKESHENKESNESGDGSRLLVPRGVFKKMQEVCGWSNLQHPNLVHVLDSGVCCPQNHVFYVMELLQGPTLQDILKEKQQLSERQAMHVTCQILSGLALLHSNGIVHSNVRPDKIFCVNTNGNIVYKLMAPKFNNPPTATAKTNPRASVMSTRVEIIDQSIDYVCPRYLSAQMTTKSPDFDTWAVAVILYECISGQLPFRGIAEIIESTHTAKKLNEICDCSGHTAAFASRGLEKEGKMAIRDAVEMLGYAQDVLLTLSMGERVVIDADPLVSKYLLQDYISEFTAFVANGGMVEVSPLLYSGCMQISRSPQSRISPRHLQLFEQRHEASSGIGTVVFSQEANAIISEIAVATSAISQQMKQSLITLEVVNFPDLEAFCLHLTHKHLVSISAILKTDDSLQLLVRGHLSHLQKTLEEIRSRYVTRDTDVSLHLLSQQQVEELYSAANHLESILVKYSQQTNLRSSAEMAIEEFYHKLDKIHSNNNNDNNMNNNNDEDAEVGDEEDERQRSRLRFWRPEINLVLSLIQGIQKKFESFPLPPNSLQALEAVDVFHQGIIRGISPIRISRVQSCLNWKRLVDFELQLKFQNTVGIDAELFLNSEGYEHQRRLVLRRLKRHLLQHACTTPAEGRIIRGWVVCPVHCVNQVCLSAEDMANKALGSGYWGKGIEVYLHSGGALRAAQEINLTGESIMILCWVAVGRVYPITREMDFDQHSARSKFHGGLPLQPSFHSHFVAVEDVPLSYPQVSAHVDSADYDIVVIRDGSQILPICKVFFNKE